MKWQTRLAAAAAACVVASSPAWAGIYYKAVTRSEAQHGDVTVQAWVDGSKAKVEFAESGNPLTPQGSYLVTKDGGQTLYLVNPEDKTYAEWDLAGMLQTFGHVMQSLGPMMNIQISDPQVEKLSEQPGGTVVGLATTHYRYRTSYDMKVKVLGMGHSNHIQSEEDIWATDALSDPGMGLWLRSDRPTGFEGLDKLIKAQMGKIHGFPLKTITVTTTTGGKKGRKQETTRTEMEVTELDRNRSTPGSTFEIPAGYTETQMLPTGEEQGGEKEGGHKNPFKGLFGKGKGKG